MADDPKAPICDKSVGGDLGPRTTHPIAVQILKVEGYDSVEPTQSQISSGAGSEPHGRPVMVSASVSAPARKKTSSFQITSVTMGSRHSNDGGDDSADDLDESHTEDLSSDVLDVSKTTDYECSSEDAFSSMKDDVATVYQPPGIQGRSHLAAPAPALSVFQTPSSAGISSNVSVTVVEAPNVPMSVVQNPDVQWQNRFRVVKIQTGEPFRRGRWVCMDFLDPPPPSTAQGDVGDKESGTGSGNSSGTGSGSVQHGESLVLETSTSQNVVTSSWSVEPNPSLMGTGPANAGFAGHCDQYPVSILLQTQQQGNLDFTNTALHMQGRTTQMPTYQPAAATGGAAPVTLQQQVTTGGAPPVSMQQQMAGVMIPSHPAPSIPMVGQQGSEFAHQIPTSQVAPPVEYAHPTAASLGHVAPVPSAAEFRTVGASMPAPANDFAPSIQSAPVAQGEVLQSTAQVAPPIQQVQQIPPPKEYVTSAPQSQIYQPPAAASVDYVNPQFSQPPALQQTAAPVPPVSQGIPASSQTMAGAPLEQQQQTYVAQPQQVTQAAPGAGHPMNSQDPISQTNQQDGISGVAQATVPNASAVSTAAATTSSESTAQEGGGTLPSGEEGDPESLQALAACLGEGQWPRTKDQSVTSLPVCSTAPANRYSASGASTVAIDNKIEQAMDLVKSHLMFAVREEVDVLKEKITELMDRINQLEYENSILKANASQETLAKLSWPPNPSTT